MWSYILPPDQKHHQEELKNNIAIPKSHYGSYSKDKIVDSKRSYHHAKRLFGWCSNGDPKQSPHHWIKNQHFLNPKGWCWGRRWRHEGRDRLVHFSLEGFCTTIFPRTSTGTRSSWSPHCKGWADLWHARIPCATYLGSICLYRRPDYCAIITDWRYDDGVRIWIKIWAILASLAILVKKGEKNFEGEMHSFRGSRADHIYWFILVV